MKGTVYKFLTIAGLFAAASAVFGQGTIDIGNLNKSAGFVQPIFSDSAAAIFQEQVGSPSTTIYSGAIPTGTTVFGGAPLVGTGYDMVFLYSLNNSVTSIWQMSVGTITPFRTAATATAAPAGTIFEIPGFAIPGTTGGTPIAFAFAAFAVDPYIAASFQANPNTPPAAIWGFVVADFNSEEDANAALGYSSIVSDVPLGGFGTNGTDYNTPNTFGGWQSFCLLPTLVPEPSTLVLSGLCGTVLLLGRRLKHQQSRAARPCELPQLVSFLKTLRTFRLFATILSMATVGAFGQGTIDVGNSQKNVFRQPIFGPGNYYYEEVGSPSTTIYSGALPSLGTTIYTSPPLQGPRYDMVFFYSLNNSVTSISQMSVGTITPFRTAPVATAAPAGTIVTMGSIPIPGTTGGTPIAFAFGAFIVDPVIFGYEANNPAATPTQIWQEALADFYSGDPSSDFGFGNIVSGVPLGGVDTAGGLHVEATTFEGWTSFTLSPEPEPSSFAIMGLGGGLLLLGRRFTSRLRPTQHSNRRDR